MSDNFKNLDAIEATLEDAKLFLTVIQSDLKQALEENEELTQQRDLLYNVMGLVARAETLEQAKNLAELAVKNQDSMNPYYQPKVGDKVKSDLDGKEYVVEEINEREETTDNGIHLLGQVLTLKNDKAVAYVYDWEVTPVKE